MSERSLVVMMSQVDALLELMRKKVLVRYGLIVPTDDRAPYKFVAELYAISRQVLVWTQTEFAITNSCVHASDSMLRWHDVTAEFQSVVTKRMENWSVREFEAWWWPDQFVGTICFEGGRKRAFDELSPQFSFLHGYLLPELASQGQHWYPTSDPMALPRLLIEDGLFKRFASYVGRLEHRRLRQMLGAEPMSIVTIKKKENTTQAAV